MSWLTPYMLEHAYELNRAARPFRRLKLPDPEGLCLRVSAHRDRYGHFRPACSTKHGCHEIAISIRLVRTMHVLVEVMGHEMLHLYQEIAGTATSAHHNAEYRRLAKTAMRCNGFGDDFIEPASES